ncbi:hypothetical protein [Parabacteroides sp. PF5-6]|uniref:hypothetical protein n=1 Tax=Parabacteroides sp. PF5-6 TaxID=1742403 RepID=UPI002406AB2A|nr:hypothetical protein [Parabacteroides sp. PF5-6]MDF9831250.1 hypothetical protein [Parabacteroides sp. PF5-6]
MKREKNSLQLSLFLWPVHHRNRLPAPMQKPPWKILCCEGTILIATSEQRRRLSSQSN